jgi:uncharacterized protein YdhG (YjbR/CyaY superfamily)
MFDFFRKNKKISVCIGKKTLKIAEPIAKRYYNLITLLEIPKFELVEEFQKQLDAKYNELIGAGASDKTSSVYSEIQTIQKNLKDELSKHVNSISNFFKNQDYETLKKIIECVCEGSVEIEDIENCYEVEVKLAVDFFLAIHLKTSMRIAQQLMRLEKSLKNHKKGWLMQN